jgi:predicted rRNA methylase YqxC with S4 and FtsJ domains
LRKIRENEENNMRIIKAKDMKSRDDVKIILDSMIPVNEFLDTISENSIEYEDICFNVQIQFSEIYEALGVEIMKITSKNLAIANLMSFRMWDYLRGEVSFDDLLAYLKKEYESRE